MSQLPRPISPSYMSFHMKMENLYLTRSSLCIAPTICLVSFVLNRSLCCCCIFFFSFSWNDTGGNVGVPTATCCCFVLFFCLLSRENQCNWLKSKKQTCKPHVVEGGTVVRFPLRASCVDRQHVQIRLNIHDERMNGLHNCSSTGPRSVYLSTGPRYSASGRSML